MHLRGTSKQSGRISVTARTTFRCFWQSYVVCSECLTILFSGIFRENSIVSTYITRQVERFYPLLSIILLCSSLLPTTNFAASSAQNVLDHRDYSSSAPRWSRLSSRCTEAHGNSIDQYLVWQCAYTATDIPAISASHVRNFFPRVNIFPVRVWVVYLSEWSGIRIQQELISSSTRTGSSDCLSRKV